MKKILLTILTFFYLMLSTGFSVELHYCMGKFSGINFTCNQNRKCQKCGMTEKKEGCCKDEIKFFKLEDNFKNSNFHIGSNVFKVISVKPYFPNWNFSSEILFVHTNFCVSEKPCYYRPPLFVRNCVFRI